MELNLIMFKNVLIGAFTTPNFTDVEPSKAADGLKRSLILAFSKDDPLLKNYENLEMYHVGVFNDETGVISSVSPVFLFSPRELIINLRAEKLAKEEAVKAEQLKKESVESTESEVAN